MARCCDHPREEHYERAAEERVVGRTRVVTGSVRMCIACYWDFTDAWNAVPWWAPWRRSRLVFQMLPYRHAYRGES